MTLLLLPTHGYSPDLTSDELDVVAPQIDDVATQRNLVSSLETIRAPIVAQDSQGAYCLATKPVQNVLAATVTKHLRRRAQRDSQAGPPHSSIVHITDTDLTLPVYADLTVIYGFGHLVEQGTITSVPSDLRTDLASAPTGVDDMVTTVVVTATGSVVHGANAIWEDNDNSIEIVSRGTPLTSSQTYTVYTAHPPGELSRVARIMSPLGQEPRIAGSRDGRRVHGRADDVAHAVRPPQVDQTVRPARWITAALMSYRRDSIKELRVWLESNAPSGWEEARTNADDNPIGFPLWRVRSAGALRRGETWRPSAEVVVISEFALAERVEEKMDDDLADMVDALSDNRRWIISSVGAMELASLGGMAQYAVARIGLDHA